MWQTVSGRVWVRKRPFPGIRCLGSSPSAGAANGGGGSVYVGRGARCVVRGIGAGSVGLEVTCWGECDPGWARCCACGVFVVLSVVVVFRDSWSDRLPAPVLSFFASGEASAPV